MEDMPLVIRAMGWVVVFLATGLSVLDFREMYYENKYRREQREKNNR